jgi:ketosteroid isomerase-like protein
MDTTESADADFRARMQQAMQAFSAAWGRGDIDGLMALMSPDPVYRTSSGAVFKGRDDVRLGFTKICQPSGAEPAPPSSQGKMEFFANTCLAYWSLPLDGKTLVDGIDVITFDNEARLISKDAYRKLA